MPPRLSILAAARFAVRLAFLASLAIFSAKLLAASDQATDDAFAALLLMPGAGPETGRWEIPEPEGFEQKTEKGLIAYLAKKKKAGADLKAYRHFGTLLHHAIRAGKIKTAIWLLDNGADPRQTLLGGTENALELSLRYQRDSLAQLLQDKYGLQTPVKSPSSAPPAPRETDPAKLPTENLSSADIELARKVLEGISWDIAGSYSNPERIEDARKRYGKWTAFAAKLPAEAFAALFDNDLVVTSLIRIHARTPAELDQALAKLPPGVLKRRTVAVIEAIGSLASVQIPEGKTPKRNYSLPAESWRVVWRHLGPAIGYPDESALAERIQPELWPELFASGYANRDAESALGCLITNVGAADLKAIWPQLLAHFPNLREVAPRLVLNHLRMPARNYCWTWADEETTNKLLFLTSQGIKAPVRGIIGDLIKDLSPNLRAAMTPFLLDKRTGASKPRFVEAKHQCLFTMTDAWYRELQGAPTVPDGYPIETVQLIELPGENECGVLVGGFYSGSSSPNDSFTGPEENPYPSCPDPAGGYQVLRNRDGRIERLESEMADYLAGSTLTPVRDTTNGQRYYLRDAGMGGGRCGGRIKLPELYVWQGVGQGAALKKVTGLAFENALFNQCRTSETGVTCDAIPSFSEIPASDPARKPTVRDGYRGMGFRDFINTFRAAQYNEYQSAILSLDKPKLKAIQQNGIPGDWTAEAIKRVGASRLPLEDKRKRTAWIFYDHAQLARSLNNEIMIGLLDWLPREDWGPILKLIAKRRDNVADVREAAQAKGLDRLACDLDHAQGLICGETWSAY